MSFKPIIKPLTLMSRPAKCPPKYLVSACLAGTPCRYDGAGCLIDAIALLVKSGKALPFCPEVAGGLLTPRPASELCGTRVINNIGKDVTKEFLLGAKKTLALMKDNKLEIAILKDFSPSCGSTMIYDGTFSKTLVPGKGITTAFLQANGIKVYTPEQYLLNEISA